MGRSVGRLSTRPRILVYSLLVTGSGAVRLTGPATSASSRKRMAATSSAMEIQLHHCRPSPNLPPRPSLKRGSDFFIMPPSTDCTRPVRRWTTLMPAASAGWVAASQALHTSGRKPAPAAVLSVHTSSPRSPYRPMADPESSTLGDAFIEASVIASSEVETAGIDLTVGRVPMQGGAVGVRTLAQHPQHLVTVGPQRRGEGGTDETGRTGDRHPLRLGSIVGTAHVRVSTHAEMISAVSSRAVAGCCR